MRHPGLKFRMVLVGTALFAFYAALAGFALSLGVTLPVVLAGSVLFVGVQYKLGKYLALRSVGAVDLPAEEFPKIHETVETISAEMGIEKPRVMIAEMGVPNAFAVGRRGAGVVVLSVSIIELLEPDELDGVIAHELAHISNRDVVMMVIGQSIASMIGIAVFWLVALADDSFVVTILGWILSAIVQFLVMLFVLAISRHREYVADSDAVAYTGNPQAMGRALAKIHEVGHHDQAADVEGNVGALCIFGGKRGLLASLTATHPPMEKRIARLAPELLAE